MDDSRKIFSGNFENGTSILPPRITSSRSRGYVAPCRRKPPPGEGEDEERVTNQKKQRYWNSYEEMYIVELWRRYKEEVTEFNKPLPVHRKIMVAMRSKDMMVTGQDCRRKLNTLNNRYKTEVQRMKLNGVKPDWRLFSMIHCIMEPKITQYDPWHETKVVKKLLEKMPKPPELKCSPLSAPAPVTNLAAVTTSAAVTTTAAPSAAACQPLLQFRGGQLHANARGSIMPSIPLQSIQTNAKIPIFFSDNAHNLSLNQSSFTHSTYTGPKSNLPFRDITLQKYHQVKLNNEILAQQRDTALRRLRLEEESLKAFETFLFDWNEQTREVLAKIERISSAPLTGVSKTGREPKNGHVEQKLSVN